MSSGNDLRSSATSVLRDRRWWLAAAVIAVAAIAFLLLRGRGAERETEQTPVVAGATAVVRVADFPVTITALGTVVPGPGAEARPAAPALTRVLRVLVAPGDQVRAGQPLVLLDAAVFQAQLVDAETALTTARAAQRRLERLVGEGISPRKELEAAAADEARARAALAEAQRNRDMGTVRSPIAGIVNEVSVTMGEPVEANQPLVDVVNPAGLSIVLHLSPEQAGRVTPGAPVLLALSGGEAAQTPGAQLGSGRVAGISGAVDSVTGSVAVRVVTTTPARRLRAGESVTGRITVGMRPRALVVPLSALVPGDEGIHVFVVGADSIAHETRVVVGERSDTEAEIISGVRAGERVVTEGAYGVSDGARIRGQGT